MQALKDVIAGECVCRGGERQAGDAGKAFVQHAEGPVFRTEIVPPLADAVRFVNGKKRQFAHREKAFQLGQKAGCCEALRGRIEQRQGAPLEALLNCLGFIQGE